MSRGSLPSNLYSPACLGNCSCGDTFENTFVIGNVSILLHAYLLYLILRYRYESAFPKKIMLIFSSASGRIVIPTSSYFCAKKVS